MERDNEQRIFVLAPHTDDGELGCGAAMAKYIAKGHEVFYIAFSTCSQSLPAGMPPDTLVTECRSATAALGLSSDHLIFFDFEVRQLLVHRQHILEELIRLNKRYSPQTVFLPAKNDIHQDHQVVYAEGLRAFKNTDLFGYELPWNNRNFSPNYFESITEDLLQKKTTALRKYGSQAHKNYMDPGFIRSLAVVRGIQADTPLAEAFEVYHFNNTF